MSNEIGGFRDFESPGPGLRPRFTSVFDAPTGDAGGMQALMGGLANAVGLAIGIGGIAGGAPGALALSGGAFGMDQLLRRLGADGELDNLDMIQLQETMQRERLFFDTMSNVMKAQHDSRMNAVQNIRG